MSLVLLPLLDGSFATVESTSVVLIQAADLIDPNGAPVSGSRVWLTCTDQSPLAIAATPGAVATALAAGAVSGTTLAAGVLDGATAAVIAGTGFTTAKIGAGSYTVTLDALPAGDATILVSGTLAAGGTAIQCAETVPGTFAIASFDLAGVQTDCVTLQFLIIAVS